MNNTTPNLSEQFDLFHGAATDRSARTRNSVLWAAYGDALGFVSELVDEKGLRRRTRGAALDRLMSWDRRVGGRGGVNVELPAGCWSDDTQLRTAVSRSISNKGFDVDTFARVELPVWPSYALGGGRASPDLEESFLLDVITDCICTHSHPRAIIGACFHASTLAHCLRTGSPPALDECWEIANQLADAPSLIKDHQNLSSVWLGLWERSTNEDFQDKWQTTIGELLKAIHHAQAAINCTGCLAEVYKAVCEHLELYAEHQRGSGILTPVAAAALATAAADPYDVIVVAANELRTDTDTIATMAGALLGACHADKSPPEEPLDVSYLLNDADRLIAISQGTQTASHQYPDILTWTAPQTQADALVTDDGQLTVEGLGPVKELNNELLWSPRKDFAWQWVQTEFGQTLIIKRRPEVRVRKAGNTLEPPPTATSSSNETSETNGRTSRHLPLDRGLDIDRAVKHALEHINDDSIVGYTVRRTARDGTINDLIALVTSIRSDLRR